MNWSDRVEKINLIFQIQKTVNHLSGEAFLKTMPDQYVQGKCFVCFSGRFYLFV